MPRNFSWTSINGSAGRRTPRFWLQVSAAVLAIANVAALYFYIAPPGGSRKDLMMESRRVKTQLAAAKATTVRLQDVAAKVQVGSTESTDFEAKYFLPKRLAYAAVIAEIQRMAKASGLAERDAVYTEEPVEGSADLSVLNITANYQGTYDNLMRFVYEADRCPMLLMLDTLQATPQQKAGQINSSIRFQAIVREQGSGTLGGQP